MLTTTRLWPRPLPPLTMDREKLTERGECYFFFYRCIKMNNKIADVVYWIGFRLKRALTTFGDKFSEKEVNDAYDNFYIDDKGFIDVPSLIAMLTGTGEDDDE